MSGGKKPGYEVGRGRPPLHTRFRPGQSGNRSGRPQGSYSFATVLRKALTDKVTITANGRQRKITKLEAITTQLVNQAAQANLPAMRLLTGLFEFHQAASQPPAHSEVSAADQKVMQDLLRRLKTFQSEASDDDAESIDGN